MRNVSNCCEHLLSVSVLVRNVSVWSTCCQCLCWWEICPVAVRLERNVSVWSTCQYLCWWEMCQFGALVVNVCADEKCVQLLWASVWNTCCQCLCWWEMCWTAVSISLEHLLSMSVLVRNVSVWNTYCQCLCWWEMCWTAVSISLEHLLSMSGLVRNVSVWSTCCQCLCWWEMCWTAVSISLEHLLSMSVMVRNVSVWNTCCQCLLLMRNVLNCCEHQFGTPVVNVWAGEKCVSLEHLLSMSVLVRSVSVWNTCYQCLCWWEMCWTAVQGSSTGSAKQKTSRMPWMGSSTSLAKSWGLRQLTISRRYRIAKHFLFSISLNWKKKSLQVVVMKDDIKKMHM